MPTAAPRASSLVGQHIGPYRILADRGQRGPGRVYDLAHDFIGHRAQAKLLPPELAMDPRNELYKGRFIDEARAVNLIDDPAVIRVFDIGERADRSSYILLEHLDGELLSQRLQVLRQANQRMPVAQALSLTRQIAGAMAKAHDKGIVHRDLQPENLVLLEDRNVPGGARVKILDFGLAKFLDSPERRTTCGVVLGAPTYLSPEQCLGNERIDGQADVYTLGVVLFEALAGQPPFSGEMREMLKAHLDRAPPGLQGLAPAAPAGVAALVARMLAKAPAERPTMAQVVEALDGIAPVDGGPRAPARRGQQVGLVLVGLLLGAGVGYLAAPRAPAGAAAGR